MAKFLNSSSSFNEHNGKNQDPSSSVNEHNGKNQNQLIFDKVKDQPSETGDCDKLKSHPIKDLDQSQKMDSCDQLKSHPVNQPQVATVESLESVNSSSSFSENCKPKTLEIPKAKDVEFKLKTPQLTNDALRAKTSELDDIMENDCSSVTPASVCKNHDVESPRMLSHSDDGIMGDMTDIVELDVLIESFLEYWDHIVSISKMTKFISVFLQDREKLKKFLLQRTNSLAIPLPLRLTLTVNKFLKTKKIAAWIKHSLPRIMPQFRQAPSHARAEPGNKTEVSASKKTNKRSNKKPNVKKNSQIQVEKSFSKTIDEFMTKAAEEAKKHEIKLPKTPKKPKTHLACSQYAHNLALQKSGFRKTKKQLNLQGMTFKRKLLKPLVTISNPCLQLQKYVRFTDLSIEQKGQYLAGYIEADGCFCTDGSNSILKLAFDPKDRFVMIGIAQGLTGNMTQEEAATYGIRFNDSKQYNQGELVIRKQALIDVLSLIHGHLMGEAKIQQIINLGLDQLVNLNFEPLPAISYSSLWLSGFMDGDGSIFYDELQKKWIIEFGQNSEVNPFLIQKICDLILTSNGITLQKKENQERVSYSHPTLVFVWLEFFQNQCLQTYKFNKLEQVKQHMQTMIKNGIQQAHIESKLWDEAFSKLDEEKKLRLLFKPEQKEIIDSFSQWEKSYNFSTRKWTQEKIDLALKLREQGYSMAQIGKHKDIQISRSHVQRFFQAPADALPPKKKIVFKLQPRPSAFLAFTLSQMNEIDLLLDQEKTNVEIGKLIGCDRRIVGNYKTNAAWTKKLAREFEKRFPDQKENKAQKKKFLKEKKAEDS